MTCNEMGGRTFPHIPLEAKANIPMVPHGGRRTQQKIQGGVYAEGGEGGGAGTGSYLGLRYGPPGPGRPLSESPIYDMLVVSDLRGPVWFAGICTRPLGVGTSRG